MIDVVIIFTMLALLAAVISMWIKKEEYKDESCRLESACQQMQKGAEIAAQRAVERKARLQAYGNLVVAQKRELSELKDELFCANQIRMGQREQLIQKGKESEQLNKDLGTCCQLRDAALAKAKNLELALAMEQKNNSLLEENMKYYMELCAEQVKGEQGTGKSEQGTVDGGMSRWALRVCLDNALRKNARLERVIKRMRDQARKALACFPQISQIDAPISRTKMELDDEYVCLHSGSGEPSGFDQGGDGYDPKVDPEIPSGEVAVPAEEHEIPGEAM